jgi:endonuclease-3
MQEKARRIADQLSTMYPDPPPGLRHESSFQLLIAVMLSAQSTDMKVNQVTPELFQKWPDAHAMSTTSVDEILAVIRVLGLAPTKSKNLSATSKALVERYQGRVPETSEELETLPGVGHKTAGVVLSQAFGHPAFAVDSHIHRIAQRWGLTDGSSVSKTEKDLKALFPPSSWRDVHLQIIYFGREHCRAGATHEPSDCPICSWAAVEPYNVSGHTPRRPK